MSEQGEAHVVRIKDEGNDPRRGRRKPSDTQRKYLGRGLDQPGGKLPLFDRHGKEFGRKTVVACIDNGWAEPWFSNPIKPDWLVCKLTAQGYRVLGAVPPEAG